MDSQEVGKIEEQKKKNLLSTMHVVLMNDAKDMDKVQISHR